MSGDHSGSKDLNRRSVLKTLGVGVAASSFPAAGTASAQRSVPDSDVTINKMTGLSPAAIEGDVESLVERDETDLLSQEISDEAGFELAASIGSESASSGVDAPPVGVQLETDDDDLNEHEPRIVHLPMTPSSVDDGPSKQPAEFSVDNGGAILGVTIEEEGERTVAGIMGISRQEARDDPVGADSGRTVTTKSFVVEDESAMVHRENVGEPLKSDLQSEFNISPDDTQFTCWGCATVVGIACAGAATLSYSTCVSAAFASSVFSPTAGAAVAAFCTYIVSNAGTLSCAAGTAVICAGVTDDCSFLED